MTKQRLPSLNARIRTRRSKLGLTGVELAQRAGISPSYVSFIEKGAKVPDEDVAARLARALEDDADLYRAWAKAWRVGLQKLELLNRLGAIGSSPQYTRLVERGEELPQAFSAEPPPLADAGPAEGSFSIEEPPAQAVLFGAPRPAQILRVPMLASGAEPGAPGNPSRAIQGHLFVDRQLLPDLDPDWLFAYEVAARDMKHLRGVASPGDRIVLRRSGRVSADRICAVRTPEGIVLARVLFKGTALLLLPGEGGSDFESVDVDGLDALPAVVAATHVLLIRR